MAVRNAVLLALVLAVLWKALPAERVHFRIYTTDLLDQHTHTRTVYLQPEKRGAWNDKGGPQTAFSFGRYPQKDEAVPPPMSVSTSTMYYPPVLLKATKYIPHPSQMHKPRPVRLVHPHQRPLTSAIVLSPHAPPAESQRYPPLRGVSQISSSGCGAFVEGNEHVDKGNCFVEQYENGYRDEESRKTFYGDGNANVNTEKHGERNSQNYRNEAVIHHDSKHRAPASDGKEYDHRGGRVKVKKYRTKAYYPEKKRIPHHGSQDHSDRPSPQHYRNEAAYHYPDKKRIPIAENNENPLAPQTTTNPPKKDEDEMDKQVYFKPLKNGKMKFIVRPSDIKYVKVHDSNKIKPGDDVKLVEITKSRKVLPGSGTKIDTVKIIENTEPLPEEDAQSEETETEGIRTVRQKSHKSERPVKTYQNVKVREKITRVITPKKSIKSESKVKPLWVQESTDPGAESAEDEYDNENDTDNENDNDNLSLGGDSFDDDDGYKVHEEQAEASEIPTLMLSSLKVQSKRRKPRRSVKYATPAPQPSFEDSWVAAQTEIAKKINEYWHANGGVDTTATATFFGGTDSKPSSSFFDSPDTKLTTSVFASADMKPRASFFENPDTKGSPSLFDSPDTKLTPSVFASADTKPRPSFFENPDTKGSPSLFDSPDSNDPGLAPRSFGAPFEFAISDSSEKSGKPLNDPFSPSSMQKEFLPSDPKHPVASGLGKSEKAIAGGSFDHSAEDSYDDMPALAKIIVTKGNIFQSAAPSSLKDSFGATDPDRLESDAGVPIVEESSHKLKGYKETREHQLKSWR